MEKARKQLIKDTNKILFYGAQFAFDAVTLIQGFVLLQYTTTFIALLQIFLLKNKFNYCSLEIDEVLNSRIDLIIAIATLVKHREEEILDATAHK